MTNNRLLCRGKESSKKKEEKKKIRTSDPKPGVQKSKQPHREKELIKRKNINKRQHKQRTLYRIELESEHKKN